MNVTSPSWPAPSKMKFDSIALEEIPAILKENQRDQETVLFQHSTFIASKPSHDTWRRTPA